MGLLHIITPMKDKTLDSATQEREPFSCLDAAEKVHDECAHTPHALQGYNEPCKI